MELLAITALAAVVLYVLGKELARWLCFFAALSGLFLIVNPIIVSRVEALAVLAASMAILAIIDRKALLVRYE